MLCSKCHYVNSPGTSFCQQCRNQLPVPAVIPPDTSSPFGDYLPAWLSSGPSGARPVVSNNGPQEGLASNNKPQSLTQDRSSGGQRPTVPANPLSIEALLRELDRAPLNNSPRPAAVENGINPGPVPDSPQTVRPPALPDSAAGIPLPNFQEPPQWFKPAAAPAWQEVKPEAERVGPAGAKFGQDSPFAGPETHEPTPEDPAEPEFGVSRGFYFYTGEFGEVVLHALSGFGRRFAGALIDAVTTAVLGTLFFILVASRIFQSNVTSQSLWLAGVALTTIFSFLYHTILVGMTGQTLGHRLMGIKVIKRGGRAVGPVSGIIRTLYGTVPALLLTILGTIVSTESYILGAINLMVYSLVAAGMACALFNNAHQGIHDMLADTYVVRAEPA
ncbi:MAG: hypothetical protein JWP00_2585 [Chloroflexi bacterium]|nr:hypothetical protein [Chloroflexota bacterium]